MAKSAITDDLEHCIECGRKAVNLHHVFFGCNRKIADIDNMVIPLCFECHVKLHNQPNQTLNYKWKRIAQSIYEETHTRGEFMSRYGKNYL